MPYLQQNFVFSRIKIRFLFMTFTTLLLGFLYYSQCYASTPLNDNLIKYRFYVKQTSLFPEFENDAVLNFEKSITAIALEYEVNKASTNYNEILNYIDTKNSSEIFIYTEFLKCLKEKLASEGIFPQKFDDINISNNNNNDKIFEEFSLNFNSSHKFNKNLPQSIIFTKRIFPFLLNQSQNKTQSDSLLKTFLDDVDKFKADPAQDAYKKAIAYTNSAYNEYCNNNFEASSKAFETSIPFWETYYNLTDNSALVPILKGTLKIYQGNSTVEYDLNSARKLYESAITFFPNDITTKMYIYWANCSIAEIYYRQNDINGFINWMKAHPAYKADQSVDDANNSLVLKTSVIQYEYNRLSQLYIWNNSTNGKKDRKSITDLLKKIESNSQNTPTNNYVKKISQRYKNIMNSNSLEIQDIMLYSLIEDAAPSVKAPIQARISLKEHSPKADNGIIILEPDWSVAVNGNSVQIKTHPAAVVRNKKLRIMVKFFSAPPANVFINGYSSLGGDFKLISLNNNIATFESVMPVSNCVKIVNDLSILIYNNGVALVKSEFSKIFIIREYLDEPCFWQVVEYTCKWLENLTQFQLDDEKSIIDAIWNGCDKNNLASMGYQYVYDPDNASPNNINQLLCNKKSSCGGWAEFLIHSFYTQGIYNTLNENGTVKKAKVFNIDIKAIGYEESPGDAIIFRTKNDILSIGNDKPDKHFPDHNFIGIGGEYQFFYNNGKKICYEYVGGEIFDIVYSKRIINANNLAYEGDVIGFIKADANSTTPEYPKDPLKRQFVIKCAIVKSYTASDGTKIPYPYFPKSEIKN